VATDYVDDYPTCTRTFASLLIHGDALVPDDVTSALGLEPTRSHTKGQLISNGRPEVRKGGFWGLSTRDSVTSRDLRRHLDWLLDIFEPRADTLSAFRESGFTCAVSCFWEGPNTGGPTFSPSQAGRLAALDLEFDVDFYSVVPDPPSVEARLLEPLTHRLATTTACAASLARDLGVLYSISAQTIEDVEHLIPSRQERAWGLVDDAPFDEYQLRLISALAERWRDANRMEMKALESFGVNAAS
jgi:hypothetical protein